MNRRFHDKDIWIFIVAAIAMLSFIVTIISQRSQKTLAVYNTADHVEAASTESADPLKNVEMQIYTDSEIGFSISIPKDWEQVTKSGAPEFIHRASGSSIRIETTAYAPAVNNVDSESASSYVTDNGMTFVGFTRTSDTSYELTYRDYQNTTYDYMEEVYWDREHIVTLMCTFDDSLYEKIIPYYEKIVKSFSWEKSDPIPNGYYLTYIADADFEIGIPDNWVTGVSGSTYVAADEETGASMMVQVSETDFYLDNLTAVDVSSLIGSGKSNFILNSFQTSSKKASASASYTQNNVQWKDDVWIFSNGTYLYVLQFDYEDGTIDDSIPSTCAGLFREFLSAKASEESQTDSGTESSAESGLQAYAGTGGGTVFGDADADKNSPAESSAMSVFSSAERHSTSFPAIGEQIR